MLVMYRLVVMVWDIFGFILIHDKGFV